MVAFWGCDNGVTGQGHRRLVLTQSVTVCDRRSANRLPRSGGSAERCNRLTDCRPCWSVEGCFVRNEWELQAWKADGENPVFIGCVIHASSLPVEMVYEAVA
jgi:hypothetical protein